MNSKNWKIIFFSLVCVMALTSCDKSKKKTAAQDQIVVAVMRTPVQPLYFSGSLTPLKTYDVFSPVDGHVNVLHFVYGSKVEKSQVVAILNSQALADSFHKAVDDYLQAKESYTNGVESFHGSEILYKAGINDKETYLNDKSQFENNELKYLQAKNQLTKVMEQAAVKDQSIFNLSIGDTQKVNDLLQRKFNDVEVLANGSGIALFPISDSSDPDSASSNKNALQVGSAVKQGQLILSIGDLSGFKMKFTISEINVNQVKVGMPAVITGSAFPGVNLKGVLTMVSSQAAPDQNNESGLAVFSVALEIPQVDPKLLSVIHVGMSAKVELDVKKPAQVMVPINAVFQKDMQSMLTILDKNGQKQTIPVVTGDSTPDGLIGIMSGVKAGDKVVIAPMLGDASDG